MGLLLRSGEWLDERETTEGFLLLLNSHEGPTKTSRTRNPARMMGCQTPWLIGTWDKGCHYGSILNLPGPRKLQVG